MSKWYEKVNKYTQSAYYLAIAEVHYMKINHDTVRNGSRALLDNAWLWLSDHNAISPQEQYRMMAGEPTIADDYKHVVHGTDLPEATDYGYAADWADIVETDSERAVVGMVLYATGSVIYNGYKYRVMGAPSDVELPPYLLAEYWKNDVEEHISLIDQEKLKSLITWLQENYPPGTEDKPVIKDEVMAIVQ